MAWNSVANIRGPQGINAFDFTTAGFVVPAVGESIVVELEDASWVVVGQMLYVEDAGGSGVAGLLEVIDKDGNELTLRNPEPGGVRFVLVPPHDPV